MAYQNGDTTLPDIFASYTIELYDVPEVDGFPIAIFSEQDDDGPASGSFTDLVFLDDFTRNAQLLARTDSLTQDSTFKVRVYGYMVKGLMAGKMVASTTNTADDLFNLPPGYSVNDDINDPNCGLPIDAVEDNIFVNCFEFRIGEPDSVQELNILLGESKYFYAISDPIDNTKLQIKEYNAENSIPSILPNDGISDAFNTDNFVEINSGDKAGIYWERKGAVISDEGEITTTDLPEGMIRVIGRYWEADQVYSVKLKASSSNRSGEIDIKVTKPERLGTEYAKAKDVFDNVINVDSLIIANAGKYGIPPQLLKAHISGEVYTKDFGPGIGEGFTPGYLYEPFTVEWWLRDDENDYVLKKEWKDNAFSVSSGSMGSGDAVPTHLHTEKQTYSANPVTIWEMVNKYSSITAATPSGDWNSYAKREDNSSELNFYNYEKPKPIYTKIVKFYEVSFSGDSIYIMANDSLANYLKYEWRGGLDSLYAQTRIASSYGFFQFLYTSAILSVRSGNGGANYSRSEIPEKLNEIEVNFRVTMIKYNELLKENTTSMWTKGYEQTWFELISNWNSKSEYSSNIYKKIKNFLPLDQ